jgi:hypothetical protein
VCVSSVPPAARIAPVVVVPLQLVSELHPLRYHEAGRRELDANIAVSPWEWGDGIDIERASSELDSLDDYRWSEAIDL